LITAKTPRALKVLERLVPEELRPLCINLLGSGPEERRSLESSVDGILRKSEEKTLRRLPNVPSRLMVLSQDCGRCLRRETFVRAYDA